jgi:predicted amino acid-binding ACT domain protein
MRPEGTMKDFAIELTDRPGELGRVATALARYGVNLKAVTGLALDKHVLLRIIADDPEAARSALEGAGIRFTQDEVVKVLLENRAGELAAVTTKLSEAKVNLRAIYLTGIVDNLVELAIVTDDAKKTKRMLE